MVDFSYSKRLCTPVPIRGVVVEMVEAIKFQVVQLNDKLHCSDNTAGRKGQADPSEEAQVPSTSALDCYESSTCGVQVGSCGANKLGKLMRSASSVVWLEQHSVGAET